MKTTIFLTLLIFTNLNLLAFSKKNHRRIICLTKEEFKALKPNFIISDKMWNAFKCGNISEDRRLLLKRKNWHFYDPTNTYHIEESLNRRFGELINHLKALVKEGKDTLAMYKTLGAITHYLQDMAVPPHVVPVYHSGNDAFDDYKVYKKSYVISPVYFNVLKDKSINDNSFYDLLNEYAQLTLKRLKDTITIKAYGLSKRITWSWFWDASSTNDFGHYGRLENNFGKTKIKVRKSWLVKKRVYKVNHIDYCNFHFAQVTAAKDASLRALLLFEKMLKQPAAIKE